MPTFRFKNENNTTPFKRRTMSDNIDELKSIVAQTLESRGVLHKMRVRTFYFAPVFSSPLFIHVVLQAQTHNEHPR
jgi:hypothetical protein